MNDYEQVKQQAVELVQNAELTQHELGVLARVYNRYLGRLVWGTSTSTVPLTDDKVKQLGRIDQLAIQLIKLCKKSYLLFAQAANLAEDIRRIAQQSVLTEDTVLRLDED